MARQTAGDASLDQLPWAYRKGHGHPIGWKAGARCATISATVRSPAGGQPTIWQVEADKKYRVGDETVLGATLVEVACTHCSLCAVQWDCARFALAVGEDFGVWAMPLEDLIWLGSRGNAGALIDKAERTGQPIQFAVRDQRS